MGKTTKISVTFYKFDACELKVYVNPQYKKDNILSGIVSHICANSNYLYEIFNLVSNAIEEKNPDGLKCKFDALLDHKGLNIAGVKIRKFKFTADFKKEVIELSVPSVKLYGSPEQDALNRNVFIEAVELGNFEITQSGNCAILLLDLSTLQVPGNCLFRTLNLDFGRIVTAKIKMLGLPNMGIYLANNSFSITAEYK